MEWTPAKPKEVGGLVDAEVPRDADGEIEAIVSPWRIQEDGVQVFDGWRWHCPAAGERGLVATREGARMEAEACLQLLRQG